MSAFEWVLKKKKMPNSYIVSSVGRWWMDIGGVIWVNISGYLWNGFEMMLFRPWFEKSQFVLLCVYVSSETLTEKLLSHTTLSVGKDRSGTSLVEQWVRDSACRCRGHGFHPWARKSPHALWTKAVSCNSWSTYAKSLCSHTRSRCSEEPMRNPRGAMRTQCNEKRHQWNKIKKGGNDLNTRVNRTWSTAWRPSLIFISEATLLSFAIMSLNRIDVYCSLVNIRFIASN